MAGERLRRHCPGRELALLHGFLLPYLGVPRKSALGTGPVSAGYLAGYLGRHQRGISLGHIRRDRILAEALATGADPLYLALVFNIDHTNAMAYANAARNLLNGPVEQALSRCRNKHESTPGTENGQAAYESPAMST